MVTKQDLDRIVAYLKTVSQKDTAFREVTFPFTGNEEVAIVKDGKNVKVKLKDLILSTPNGITINQVNGNWMIDGTDTGIKAEGPQGIQGESIKLRFNRAINKFEVSYSNNPATWFPISDSVIPIVKQINNMLAVSTNNGDSYDYSDFIAAYFEYRDNQIWYRQNPKDDNSWKPLSPKFTENLAIKGYLKAKEDLMKIKNPKVGDMYMVEDGNVIEGGVKWRLWVWANDFRQDPPKLDWIDNGNFTGSIINTIEQMTGNSKTTVMSQDAVTRELNKIDRVFDGGRADTVYGGSRTIDCGGADATYNELLNK